MLTLITGANRGIGHALAVQSLTLGSTVIGAARKAGEAPGVEWVTCDVTSESDLEALARTLGDRPLDRLICNAGVYLDRGTRAGAGPSPQVWAQTLAVNVIGVARVVETVLPNLRAAKGRIAILSSQLGSSARASGGSYAYRASKAAVLNLGLNLAADLRGEGISVGIYHPGWVQSEMGGKSADITEADSAAGLLKRIAALGPAHTGVFENWDGREHPI